MNTTTDVILPFDYHLDQNISANISNDEYITLAKGAKDYVVRSGKNTYSFYIVHTSAGFVNLVACKKGFRAEWLSDPFTIRGVVADDQNNYYAELEIRGNHVRIPFEQLTPDKIHASLFGKGVAIRKTDHADEALSTHLQWLLSKFEAQDKFALTAQAASAENYSNLLSKNTRAALLESAKDCKHLGGTPPIGYSVTPEGYYEIDETKAPIVRNIYKYYLSGMGYDDIMKHLQQSGYKTSNGNDFSTSSISAILKNPKYMGTYI